MAAEIISWREIAAQVDKRSNYRALFTGDLENDIATRVWFRVRMFDNRMVARYLGLEQQENGSSSCGVTHNGPFQIGSRYGYIKCAACGTIWSKPNKDRVVSIKFVDMVRDKGK